MTIGIIILSTPSGLTAGLSGMIHSIARGTIMPGTVRTAIPITTGDITVPSGAEADLSTTFRIPDSPLPAAAPPARPVAA